MFKKDGQEDSLDPHIHLLTCVPDAVHLGKSIRCSFHNWCLILDNQRSSLAVVRTLRERSCPEVRSKVRKYLKNADTVRNKDRMAVQPVTDLGNSDFCEFLDGLGIVVHNLVPELYRFTEDNKVGLYPHPVDVCVGESGFLYILDLAQADESQESRLVSLQLHNPVRCTVVKRKLEGAQSLCFNSGIVYVATAKGLVHYSRKRSKSKAATDLVKVSPVVQPNIVCSGNSGNLFVLCDAKRLIFNIVLKQSQAGINGKSTEVCSYPDECCISMGAVLHDGVLYFSMRGQNGGLYGQDLVAGICTKFVNGSEHNVSRLGIYKTHVLFTDPEAHTLKLFQDGQVITFAGNGTEGYAVGVAASSSFFQPLGVAVEFGETVYVTDAQCGSVKLIIDIKSTGKFLQKMGNLYQAFGVKSQTVATSDCTLEVCQSILADIQAYLDSLSSQARVAANKRPATATNGPDGTISAKTQGSVQLLAHGMNRLSTILQDISPTCYNNIDLYSCLTMQVENLHATHHFKHQEMPTVLEFARSFGNTVKETLKKQTKWAVHYFTAPKSHYADARSNISFNDIPKLQPLPSVMMNEGDKIIMRAYAADHGKALKQRSVRQETTKYKAGTLPLNMYVHELQVGDRIALNMEEDVDSSTGTAELLEDVTACIDSEYSEDSDSDAEYSDPTEGTDSVDASRQICPKLDFLLTTSRFGRNIKVNTKYLS